MDADIKGALSPKEKIAKAKAIIQDIFSLSLRNIDHTPIGYGNWELNKATDSMYEYIKTIQDEN
jgi:hypothetical protein